MLKIGGNWEYSFRFPKYEYTQEEWESLGYPKEGIVPCNLKKLPGETLLIEYISDNIEVTFSVSWLNIVDIIRFHKGELSCIDGCAGSGSNVTISDEGEWVEIITNTAGGDDPVYSEIKIPRKLFMDELGNSVELTDITE